MTSHEDLKRVMRNKTDEDLYRILYLHELEYTHEAIRIANEEFRSRNLDAATVGRIAASTRGLAEKGKEMGGGRREPVTAYEELTKSNGGAGRRGMALRFQGITPLDEAAKENTKSHFRWGVAFFVLFALILGVTYLVSGGSLHSYKEDLGSAITTIFVFWLVFTIYDDFRARTNEIYGTVAEIEKTVSAVKEDQKELLDKLSAIEEALSSLKYEN